jgi:hypothetical protein
MITAKFNGAGLRSKLKSIRPALQKVTPDIVQRSARLAAVSCAISTQPYGSGIDAKTLGETAVARDIRKVYGTVGEIFGMIRIINPNQAEAFWACIVAGNITKAQGIYRSTLSRGMQINAPWGKFDGGTLHKSARKSRGHVAIHQGKLLIVTNPKALSRYIARHKNMVGFAKGAWAQIAKQLGGIRGLRSHASIEDDSKDITASWILRHRNAPNRIQRHEGETKTWILITSLVEYADDTLPIGERKNAERIARERLKKNIMIAARYEARKALKHN